MSLLFVLLISSFAFAQDTTQAPEVVSVSPDPVVEETAPIEKIVLLAENIAVEETTPLEPAVEVTSKVVPIQELPIVEETTPPETIEEVIPAEDVTPKVVEETVPLTEPVAEQPTAEEEIIGKTEEVTNLIEKTQNPTEEIMDVPENKKNTTLPVEETIIPVEVVETPTKEDTLIPVEETVNTPTQDVITGDVVAPIVEKKTELLQEKKNPIKSVLKIVIGALTYIKGEVVDIQAQLSDKNDVPLAQQSVDLTLDGNTVSTKTTDEQGNVEFEWDTSPFSPGVYVVGVDFAGSADFEASISSTEVIIQEKPIKNEIAADTIIPATKADSKKKIQEKKNCFEEKREETIYTLGLCTEQKATLVCENSALNSTCKHVMMPQEVECVTGKEKREVSKQKCETVGYTIDTNEAIVDLNTPGFGCLSEQKGKKVVMTCDSIFDGNGDGVCSSGESCVRYEVEGKNVKKQEKNSKENFKEVDESFFVKRSLEEVVQ